MSVGAQIRQMDAEADAVARAEYEAQQMTQQDQALMDADGRPTNLGWRRISDNLRKPMATRSFRGKGGREMQYISARQVAERLDAVVGAGNWSDRYRVLTTEPWVIECTIEVFGTRKSDCGYENAPEAEPGQGGYEEEPAKSAYSDAFKRAAVKYGVGRWLYPEMKS